MTKCPRCNVWLPVDHDHSEAECDEHIQQGRAIARRDAVWQRQYAAGRPQAEQLGMVMEVER